MQDKIFIPLICILGKSGSGKSTLVSHLEQYGSKQIPSYTTRQPRYENEAGHIFVTKDEFAKIRKDIVAYNNYLNNDYGITTQQIDNLDYDLYVVDKTGLESLRKSYKGTRPIWSIYIDCSDINLHDRLYNRYYKIYNTPEKAEEKTSARMLQDKKEFKDVENIVDFIIQNNNEDINIAKNELVSKMIDIVNRAKSDMDYEYKKYLGDVDNEEI